MGEPLRVLIVDDSERDSTLLIRSLRQTGYEPDFERVDTAVSMRKAISNRSWDVVLCDSRMPGFSPESALSIWSTGGHDAPFIVVSGAIEDEKAVELLKLGAEDFVRKDNLARLVPAIERGLRESEQRRKRQLAEDALRKSEDRYVRLFKGVEISIWDQDLTEVFRSLRRLRDQGVTDLRQHLANNPRVTSDLLQQVRVNNANTAALRLVGATSTAQLQAALSEIFSGESLGAFVDELCAIWDGAAALRIETRLHTLECRELSVIVSMPVPKWGEEYHSIPVSILDITERQKAEQQLRDSEARLNYLAHHDVLTKLPNRLLFQDRLQHAMHKAKRAGQQVAILFLDLDRFKTINDSLGHETGDRLLRLVADRLHECMRNSDTVARLGGDEFVVIVEELQELTEVMQVARKILSKMLVPMTIGEHELSVTASIGISVYPDDTDTVEGLMKCADMAMYRAKEHGRNNYEFYTPDLNQRAVDLLLLESELKKGLVEDQMIIHYQPQFDLLDRRIIGMEALVRWQHPRRGLVPPNDFIPLAEETGLIMSIDEWVLRTACTQNRALQLAGFEPFKVAVNLSARQFRQRNLVETVAKVLSETGLAPAHLELELTETAIMSDAESTIATLKALRGMGVTLAIDDFGTGYSSLSYLKRFPVDRLKIDRSFVHNCIHDPTDAAIITSIVALAHSMNFEVVAEGVETEEQAAFLREQGSDAAQGFLYSPPMPSPALAAFLGQPDAVHGSKR
jgi:diguanylate cyclase (GGDEF)-like protein